MLLEHERYYAFGMDALFVVSHRPWSLTSCKEMEMLLKPPHAGFTRLRPTSNKQGRCPNPRECRTTPCLLCGYSRSCKMVTFTPFHGAIYPTDRFSLFDMVCPFLKLSFSRLSRSLATHLVPFSARSQQGRLPVRNSILGEGRALYRIVLCTLSRFGCLLTSSQACLHILILVCLRVKSDPCMVPSVNGTQQRTVN